ncbi:hypothetical protein DAEQUDRAFT_391598 [Daedalea quercina L-15889]|uniref:Uncharacterized protein n=1 Tax=Daedalea quercina L-15889 TaxID=1314783 RepID=A0A165NVN9_9APHY|nr:hypothetical protein DAEQUDRAFT_391598 [Daedalea quercina L-15889]
MHVCDCRNRTRASSSQTGSSRRRTAHSRALCLPVRALKVCGTLEGSFSSNNTSMATLPYETLLHWTVYSLDLESVELLLLHGACTSWGWMVTVPDCRTSMEECLDGLPSRLWTAMSVFLLVSTANARVPWDRQDMKCATSAKTSKFSKWAR